MAYYPLATAEASRLLLLGPIRNHSALQKNSLKGYGFRDEAGIEMDEEEIWRT